MSAYRKKLSGAEYRKKKVEESTKKDDLLKKIPKISNFMTSSLKSSNNDQLPPCLSATIEDILAPNIEEIQSNPPSPQGTEEIQSNPPVINLLSDNSIKDNVLGIHSDPFLWNLNEETRDYIILNGTPQNNIQSIDFKNSKNVYSDKTRYCSKNLFQRTLKNGEIQRREWLIYSEIKRSVFCIPCLLFCRSNETNAFTGEGFRDWKNSKARVEGHENSDFHKTNVSHVKARAVARGRVDQHLIKQLDEEISYWKKILYRVIAIVKSLAIRGLPFRGHSERIGDSHNGNFLGSVELLAEFDPFLSEHLKSYAHPGSGHTSYLSKTIYEEIILLIQSKVLEHISTEVQSAKYFGIIVDSTPDIAHVDQLTIIIRYVRANGEVVERFLEFIPNTGHKAKDIESAILNSLEKNRLDIMNCRGQSYDNASNMSGIYSGLQTRIKTINSLADYVPCAAHSLNLVGTCAAESVLEAVDFFSTLQKLYNFFTISTHRWEVLAQHTHLRLKSLSQTRWSARHDACYALEKEWCAIIEALDFIAKNKDEKPSTRSEATGLKQKLQHLDTAILVIVWNVILDRFNAVSKKLQESQIDLSSVVHLYGSLSFFLQDMRDKQFLEYEEKAKALSGVQDYYRSDSDTRRRKIRKLQPDESRVNERAPISGQENFRTNIFYPILDTLSVQLARRKDVYGKLYADFNLFDNLSEMETNELKNQSNELVNKYPDDLEETLGNECIHFHHHIKDLLGNTEDVRSAKNICNVLHSQNLRDVYPNLDIALRIFLSIPATNCSGERSFSTLKRVKNYLRASMGQDRLNALALLSIETELVQELDYDDIIDIFARSKARKKKM